MVSIIKTDYNRSNALCFAYECHNIRDFSENKHRNVDDTPYGGGAGMVMAAPPIVACYESITRTLAEGERCRTVYLSPRGRRFDQAMAAELATLDRLILLCGHYEGVDERAILELGAEEVSIGDFVLSGGETAACVVTDAVARLLPPYHCTKCAITASSNRSFSDLTYMFR